MENKLPERKPTRLKYHDYGKPGAYFVTICTEDRAEILSTICGNTVVGEGSPLPRLTTYGEIVREYINEIPNKYPLITIDQYVIMPNHIHLILTIHNVGGRGNPSPTTADAVIGWFKYHITKKINEIAKTPGRKIFQRSFHDRVIRNRKEYQKIATYIRENPLLWEDDCFYGGEDDAFCELLLKQYEDEQDKGQYVTIEEMAKTCGVDMERICQTENRQSEETE